MVEEQRIEFERIKQQQQLEHRDISDTATLATDTTMDTNALPEGVYICMCICICLCMCKY